MTFNAFCPRTRKTYVNVVIEPNYGIVRVAPRKGIPVQELVLLPQVGFSDALGAPVFLGDTFRRTAGNVVETFVVGPLPAKGEMVTNFHLGRIKVKGRPNDASTLREQQPLSPVAFVATLERAGNIFVNFANFVPAGDSCYQCPFWQASDHGVIYCRLLAEGSLIDDSAAEYQKALLHFGSDSAVEAANEIWLVWDQVKACGVKRQRDRRDQRATRNVNG